jgi:hypothetical protein
MQDNIFGIAYQAGLRALDKQERVVDELRARTGVLLGASALAVSFLGGPALEQAHAGTALVVLIAFGVALASCMYVLLPKPGFIFALSGRSVLESLFSVEDNIDEVRRRLAYDLDGFWEENDVLMQRLFLSFRVASAALTVEIAVLLLAAGGTVL